MKQMMGREDVEESLQSQELQLDQTTTKILYMTKLLSTRLIRLALCHKLPLESQIWISCRHSLSFATKNLCTTLSLTSQINLDKTWRALLSTWSHPRLEWNQATEETSKPCNSAKVPLGWTSMQVTCNNLTQTSIKMFTAVKSARNLSTPKMCMALRAAL